MSSPPPLQGSSRMTGGILRGRAMGNAVNHADFSHEDNDALALVKPTLTFKIYVHVESGNVLSLNKAPDFAVQLPLTVFLLSGTLLLAQLLLMRAAQFHDLILSRFYYLSSELNLNLLDRFSCILSFQSFWPVALEFTGIIFCYSWRSLLCPHIPGGFQIGRASCRERV